jgi:hypothetical protein
MKICEVAIPIPDADTCAVYAIAQVTNTSPEQVWAYAEPLWKRRFGMHSGQISSVLTSLGYQFGRFRYDLVYRPRKSPTDPYVHLTLGQLVSMLKKTPQPPLLIGTRGHSIGYRDGRIVDVADTGPRSRVEAVYEVVPKSIHEDAGRMTYYHGTNRDFDVFEPYDGALGHGVYLSMYDFVARDYAERRAREQGGTPRVIQAEVNGNILWNGTPEFQQATDAAAQMVRQADRQGRQLFSNDAIREVVKRMGYVGLGSAENLVVFDPRNIRQL